MNCARLIGTALILTFSSLPCMAGDETKPPTRTISVTGTATVKVVPDEVTLSIGVTSTNLSLETAKNEVDAAIKKVMAVVKEMQIEAKDVQTDRLSMRPKYQQFCGAQSDRPDKPPVFVGYCVSNDVCIILRDTSRCEQLITALLAAGVNTIDDVDFETSKLRQHRDKARLMAVQVAKEKAALIAGEFGMKVGKPITITEVPQTLRYGRYRSSNLQVQQAVSGGDSNALPEEQGTVALGQIDVTATVDVTFELE